MTSCSSRAAGRNCAHSPTPTIARRGLINTLAAAGSRYLPRTVTLPVQATLGAVVRRLGA